MTLHTPFVDIVIPTRGRGELIAVTIESILHSHFTNFTLWVIDQSPDEKTKQAVMRYASIDARIRYVGTPTKGSNVARNIGVGVSKSPYIVFTDDDTRVDPHWLGHMVDELSQAGTWAVFGQILPDTEGHAPSEADEKLAKKIPMALQSKPTREVFEGNRFNLGFGHGANMAITRACYQAIGGFDNLLGAGGPLRSWPERDLGYRVLGQGGRIIYTPKAILYHRHWRSWEEVRKTYRNYGIGTGAAIGKYVRCGDYAASYMFVEWILDQGVRAMASGLLKWRSKEKFTVGCFQIIYPWVGLFQSLRYRVNREQMVFQSPTEFEVEPDPFEGAVSLSSL